MFHPLTGFWQKEHADAQVKPHTSKTYGGDYSGRNEYRFNSLGFRGPEPELKDKFTIFVFGCSHGIGVGVNEHELWHTHFKNHLAEALGREQSSIEVVNFSSCGSSSDLVCRMLLTQCSVVKPDLVLVEFAEKNRAEGFSNGKALPIGIWMNRNWFVRMFAGVRKSWQLKRFDADIFRHFRKVGLFYSYYSEELGMMNALRNMLLVQYFCKSNNIDYILTFAGNQLFDTPEYKDNPVFSPLIDLLDPQYFCRNTIYQDGIHVDLSVDNAHVGTQSHQNFGDALWAFFKQSPLSRILETTPRSALNGQAAANHAIAVESAGN